jgi:predicted acetyltransferase
MLKIIDVPGAINCRRYPPGLTTHLGFRLQGDFLPENDGGYAIAVADGRAECVRADRDGDRVITPQGLALLYAGAQSTANLRAAGHLTGGDIEQDLDWDALFGGRQLHIRDYF